MDTSPDYYTQQSFAFTIDGENKIFQDKNKFKQYIAINQALQKILEGKSQIKEVNNTHNNTSI